MRRARSDGRRSSAWSSTKLAVLGTMVLALEAQLIRPRIELTLYLGYRSLLIASVKQEHGCTIIISQSAVQAAFALPYPYLLDPVKRKLLGKSRRKASQKACLSSSGTI